MKYPPWELKIHVKLAVKCHGCVSGEGGVGGGGGVSGGYVRVT